MSPPQRRRLDRLKSCMKTPRARHNRSDVSKISNPDKDLATEWLITAAELTRYDIDCLNRSSVGHRQLIPDYKYSLAKKFCAISSWDNIAM
ncbi:hypothetical protein H4R24_004838 [Coemansia sp. RSA 988]|nr:hypothetical protein H4R24_004838 [Coemansia sp. RSA 988]